jgi:hypothetical protein
MFLEHLWISEDQRFFQHEGFDWKEMDLAMKKAERKGKPVRGASTITNQCARSIFLWQGRSWIRKGLESYYTVWMEALLPKRRILELYANVIEMGRGIYGVEAASQHYFGISARGLTRDQSAMLAAVLPNPKGWDPTNPSRMLRWRQRRILQRERNANDLLHKSRFFAFSPQFRAMPDAVVKRTTVRTRASLKWPGNTDELGLESVRCNFYRRISVTAQIDERKMRGQFGIGKRTCFLQIAALRILQTGTNSVMHQHIDQRPWLFLAGNVCEKERTRGNGLVCFVLHRFGKARC